MKIRLVSSSSGSRGGGEFYLHSLALGLRELGHDVTTLMSIDSQMDEMAHQFEKSSLRVVRWPYRNTYHRRLRSFQAAFAQEEISACVKVFSEGTPDIVHINQQCLEDGLDLVQAASRCQIPAVSTIHVTKTMVELNAVGGWLRDRLAYRVLVQSEIDLIGISETSATDLAKFVNGLPELENDKLDSEENASSQAKAGQRCSVYAVPNGVPLPVVKDRTCVRQSWGIPLDAVVLGCVARVERQKNPLFIVPLMEKLPSSVHFVWIGDGRKMDALRAAIQSEGLESRVHLGGWQEDASSYLNSFDIFVLPSYYEGLPLALLEAMAHGLPSVASDVDGMGDAVEHGISGFLCPVGDISSWTSNLHKLINSPELRAKIGEAARLRHQRLFSLKAMAERTVAVYEDVIRKHAEKAR